MTIRIKLYGLLALISGLTSLTQTEARFAQPKDLETEIEFYNRLLDIKADGKSKQTIEFKIKILNDSGRTNLATQPQYYDESSQRLKIISAKTIDEGQEYPVESAMIEDKPVASQAQGFSSYRQVLVSFPRIHVGSVLYLKYELEQFNPYLPHTFSTEFVYEVGSLLHQGHVELNSELPMKVGVNDPEGFLKVESKNQGKKFHLEIDLRKPITKRVIEEDSALVDPKALPWVSVTSIHEWKEIIHQMAPKYEEILSQPLPGLFQEIAEKVKSEKDLMTMINRVTTLLAENLNYMGDWRTNSGKLFPRSLDQIARERRGDCKDFSTSTAAILRSLGISAHPALVRRGGHYDSPNDLPDTSAFNHAIVRVEHQGKIDWIDPTNFASYAHGLFPDIANRWALPLVTKATGRDRIPALKPEDSQEITQEEIRLLSPDTALRRGEITETGTHAISLAGAKLRASRESIDFYLMSFIGDMKRMSRWKITPHEDLTSRIVADKKFNYEYEERNNQLKTSDGPAYLIPNLSLSHQYLTRVQDRVSGLLVNDRPAIFKKVTLFKKAKLRGKNQLSCTIQYPWLKASRKVAQTKNGIEATDYFRVEQEIIPNDTLRSKEFGEFQREFEKCFINVAVVVGK